MDPNETLDELRNLLDEIPDDTGSISRVAELFSALDHWLSRGGFLPQLWQNASVDDLK